jgi:homogentisate 1,2-dioxygenase
MLIETLRRERLQMPYFMSTGQVPRKRFSQFPDEQGKLFSAEVMGEEGFSSNMSLLYHRHPPSAVVRVEAAEFFAPVLKPNFPLLPRLFDTKDMAAGGDPVAQRHLLCGNADVLVSFVAADSASGLYRNATGAELYFVHEGGARLETVFGSFEIGKGDYVVIPKATTHRWIPQADNPLRALVFEVSGHIRPPRRYLTGTGQFHQEAPYSELDLRRPEGPLLVEGDNVEVTVKTREGLTRYTYAKHPFDVVGWFGCNYPFVLNIADFSPITGSFHRPPPVHQVFEADNCVFCNFVPRMLDYDPRAMPVPSYHSNVDSDEFIFYAEGNFFSRKGSGISRGAISLHPAGHLHGPHPGSWENGPSRVGQRTEEIAVMLDTFNPLLLGPAALASERPDYVMSWAPAKP